MENQNNDDWEEVAPDVYLFRRIGTVSTQQPLAVVPKPEPKVVALKKPAISKPVVKKPDIGKPQIRQRNPATTVSIAVIMMVYNRNGMRLRNTLDSLLKYQNVLPEEVLVVDTSTDKSISDGVAQVVNCYPSAKLIRKEHRVFSKPWALNVGIRSVVRCQHIACMDMDVMLSTNFIEVVMKILGRSKAFVLTDTLMMSEQVDDPFEDWNRLCSACSVAHPRGPGSFQAANRIWWFSAHGYNEKFSGGLGGMDDDMWIRAKRGGLGIVWITPDQAQAVHQWHEPSPLKGKTSHLFHVNPRVVANPKSWGK